MIELIYVGGYGRSGSTLLDAMLSEASGAFSGGELSQVFDWADSARPCGCGVALADCAFWKPVLQELADATGFNVKTMSSVSRAAEMSGKQQPAWLLLWTELFGALGRRGILRVIDSSKSTGGSRRALMLAELPNVDVRLFIHLQRSLGGVVYSRRRGNNKHLEFGMQSAHTLPQSLKALLGWVRANVAASREAQEYSSTALTYEGLVADPRAEVDNLLCLAGWNEPVGQQAMGQHTVAGNRMRRTTWNGVVSADREWEQELPRAWKILARATQRGIHRLGYLGR